MKTIIKTKSSECLDAAKRYGWDWDDFHKLDQGGYQAIKEQALMGQQDECAYTGLWLGEGTKQTIHIDHFKKKSIYPELTFDWNNLFVAAKDLDCGADFKDNSIHGPKEYSDRIYKDVFSPLEANLNQYFWYQQDGSIIPHPNIKDEVILFKAKRTIEIFNLNSSYLKNRRGGIIKMIRGLDGMDESDIRIFLGRLGFSSVVDFELENRQ